MVCILLVFFLFVYYVETWQSHLTTETASNFHSQSLILIIALAQNGTI